MIRRFILLFTALSIFVGNVQPVGATNPRELTVLTRNMDAGSDFWYVLSADPNNLGSILLGITQTYQEMLASNIPKRADGIAREIQIYRPAMVALQEVTTISSGPLGTTSMNIDANGFDALMADLKTRGLHYKAVFVQKNTDIVLPALDASYQPTVQVGLTDYDAVLVRCDLLADGLTLRKVNAQHFSDPATLMYSVAGQSIPFYRGWIAVDAKYRGMDYRFVTTHLETFSPGYQQAQANELIMGPLNTQLPLILAGDLNSDAIAPSWGNGPAYGMLTAAGFVDAWTSLRPNDLGVTWPLFLEDSGIGPSTPQRIDLVLLKGRVVPVQTTETGLTPVNGIWSSDHAGVATVIKIEKK